MTNTLRKFKFSLAIVLSVFLLLPIGSCERKQLESGTGVKIESADSSATSGLESPTPAPHRKDYLVLINGPEKSIGYWLCLLAFTWPILLVQIRRGFPRIDRFRVTLNIIEVVFTAFSLWIVFSTLFKSWYRPTVWGYALLAIIVSYSLSLMIETVVLYLSKFGLMSDITRR
jgi:hypothetical protein